ncbi:MAG TPA: bifunctional UDP-sugar hydrolase/5'-nucleotidase, partial [Thermodesulfovibrionales bacterium]|nr:bifunctional UDP-sugar hydrolase/5'-nucleotidase [Thermodesulfovibrionales bacterium]
MKVMHAEKVLIRAVFTIILLLLSSLCIAEVHGPVALTVLHLNDFHGRLLPSLVKSVDEKTPVGGAAFLAQMIEDERAKNPEGTILLSAGDMFQGSPESNIFRGEPVIEVMNYLKFDAMALGNHEFDWGLGPLRRLEASAAFPFLSATVTDRGGKGIPGIRPFVMLERKGLKIAVIGITTPETAYTTKPDNVSDLKFLDPVKVLPGLIRKVKEKGADIVVVLCHSGLDADRRLAGAVGGIDLIVGGHSHTAVMYPERVGKTIIVQAGYYGIYLGVLNLAVDPETGMIHSDTGTKELRTVFAGPDDRIDRKTAEIVRTYRDRLQDSFASVVGETSVDLMRIDRGESLVGDIVTDAMRESSGADIAFLSSGSMRADITKGPITMEQVFSLLPFDDVLMTMKLTGKQIL